MKISVLAFLLAAGISGATSVAGGASTAINDALGKEDESYWSRLMQETDDMSVAPTGQPPTLEPPTEPPTSPPPTPAAVTPPPTPSPTPVPPTAPPPTEGAPTEAPPTEGAPTEAPPTGEAPTAPAPTAPAPTPAAVTPPPTPSPTPPPVPLTLLPTSGPTPGSVGGQCELDVTVECVANGLTCEEAASEISVGDVLPVGFNYTFTNIGTVDATVLSLSSNFTFETVILTGSATFTGLILAPGETFVFNLPVDDVTVPEGGVTVLVNTLLVGENAEGEECTATDETEFSFSAGGGETDETIAQILEGDDRFTVLVGLLTESGLLPPLNGTGPLTLFAPTNAAFEALNLPPDTDPAVITDVLLYHVVGEEVPLENGLVVPTLNGATVELTVTATETQVNESNITETIGASNGIIYVIDAVLLPPPDEPSRRNLRARNST